MSAAPPGRGCATGAIWPDAPPTASGVNTVQVVPVPEPVNSLASGHTWLAVFAIIALATGNLDEAILLMLADIAHQLHQMRADGRDYFGNQDHGDQ